MSIEGPDLDGPDEDKLLVAEYVLGLLSPAEHEALRQRLVREPLLREELRLWQLRLSSLDREFAETPAPASVMQKLETRLFADAQPTPRSGLASIWDNLMLWRGLTAGALAIAAVAVGFSVMRPATPSPDEFAKQLVAALQSQEGSGVEFVAFYDTATKNVRLIGLAGQQPANQDFELWYIRGEEPAVSMGVIPVDARTEIPLDAAAQAKIDEGTILAVTLEQKGGSPTGVAQGPIVALGKATAI